MADQNRCNVCQEQAFHKCSCCQIVYYCSKDHQKADWNYHKKNCQLFKVSSNSSIGRYLMATRDLKANEIILKEKPLIYGPAQETAPVCLGCNQDLSATTYRPCFKCGWPMCSDRCAANPCHSPECYYLRQSGEKPRVQDFGSPNPLYQYIVVLRCLYQKKNDVSLWEKLNKLESHCQQRKATQRYFTDKLMAIEIIQKVLKLEDEFNLEEIIKISGVIMVNAHEVPLSEPPYIAIYEKTSMFENDCSSNCSKSFTSAGDILITAGHDIKKGEHLSICYADPLWSTTARRNFLNETKFFWCSCRRCLDPTEFGTYFSAFSCQNGECHGYLLPKSFATPEQELQSWGCSKCNYSVSHLLVNTLSTKIGVEVANLDKYSETECKRFLHKLRTILPGHNFHLVEVKLALSQLIGQLSSRGLAAVLDEDLELKRMLCRELIGLTEILIPSEKRVRGLLLFEMHSTLAEQARRASNNFVETGEVASLEESRIYLIQCIELLKHEPQVMPEGKICEQARKHLRDLTNLLEK